MSKHSEGLSSCHNDQEQVSEALSFTRISNITHFDISKSLKLLTDMTDDQYILNVTKSRLILAIIKGEKLMRFGLIQKNRIT